MKKVLLNLTAILALLLLFSSVMSAQRGQRQASPKAGPFQAIEELSEELKLTPEQEQAVAELKTTYRAAFKGQRQRAQAGRQAQRAEMKALHDDLIEDLGEVLTPEQTQILEAHREAKRAEMQASRKSLRKAMKAYHEEEVEPVLLRQRVKLEEKISEADKAKIAELRAEIRQRKKANRGQGARPRPQGGKADHPNREAVKALVEKYDAEITALFAEIQTEREEWKAGQAALLKEHRPEGGKGRKHRQSLKARPDMQKARFLLMDPARVPQIEDNIRE